MRAGKIKISAPAVIRTRVTRFRVSGDNQATLQELRTYNLLSHPSVDVPVDQKFESWGRDESVYNLYPTVVHLHHQDVVLTVEGKGIVCERLTLTAILFLLHAGLPCHVHVHLATV